MATVVPHTVDPDGTGDYSLNIDGTSSTPRLKSMEKEIEKMKEEIDEKELRP